MGVTNANLRSRTQTIHGVTTNEQELRGLQESVPSDYEEIHTEIFESKKAYEDQGGTTQYLDYELVDYSETINPNCPRWIKMDKPTGYTAGEQLGIMGE
jgi:hypothetical protein